MNKVFLLLLLLNATLFAQISFEDYFQNKQLRLDYFHSGNSVDDYFTFDELIEEPYWGGSKVNLIDTINYGNFMFFVYDLKSKKLIYSRGFSSLFQEWQTTKEAKKISRTFTETIVFPYPKDSVLVEIHDRDKQNNFRKRHEFIIDPNSYFVVKERKNKAKNFRLHYVGDSAEKLDIVFLPEGYSRTEMKKYYDDCKRFTECLLRYEPFKRNKLNINIWGVYAHSNQSGTDIPADSIWKNTILNSSFYTFDSERYLMTMDNKSVRNYASNVPYDQIYILANSEKYGGGAIYNYYSCTAVDNPMSEKIFIHEFGHGLAGLADEYAADTTFNEFYPLDVEPWEPNITTLVDFDSKWKHLLPEDAKYPNTNIGKNKLQIGVYEGGGYVEKGVYRSTPSGLMKGWDVDEFNEVSKAAIEKIIRFYSK